MEHTLVIRARRACAPLRWPAGVSLLCTLAACALTAAAATAQPAGVSGGAPAAAAAGAAPSPAVVDATVANPKEVSEAHIELGERLVDDAQDTLHQYIPTEALWRKSAAQIQAGMRLNPEESRYPRLLAEAMVELGDTQGAIDALTAYLHVLIDKRADDPVARCRLIDLYLSQLQTNDARIAYLDDVVSKAGFAPEVQAHAAVLAVPLLTERSRAEAVQMATQAIQLDPLNARAQRYYYELVAREQDPSLQVRALLARLRADPAQVPVFAELGRQLARAGLAKESLMWFDRALSLETQMRNTSNLDLVIEYCAELYIAGFTNTVDDLTARLLSSQPDNIDALFMRLALKKDQTQGIIYENELQTARTQLLRHATTVARQIIAGPTSRPALGQGGDPVPAAVAVIKQGQVAPEMAAAMISAATDAAWLECYFAKRPAEGSRWVQVLAQLLPANDLTLVRMQGWLDLVSGDARSARARLSTIQDRDPLAALGIVTILSAEAPPAAPATAPAPAPIPVVVPSAPLRPAAVAPATRTAARAAVAAAPATRPAAPTTAPVPGGAQADAIAHRLLQENRTGLLGMMVSAALRDRHIQLETTPMAKAMNDEIGKFDKIWLEILDRPEKFYFLSASSVGSTKLGQPVLAPITLQTRNYDISVGPDGTIKPDLWFDAQVVLANERNFPMSAYARVSGVQTLRAGSSSTQLVRVDQGDLAQVLRERPAASMTLYITAMSNPLVQGQDVVRGPAGQRRQLPKFIRSGAKLETEADKKRIFAGLDGTPAEKMQTMEVLAAYIRQSREQGAAARLMLLAPELQLQIDRMRKDVVPGVAAWADYQTALLTADAGAREPLLMTMAGSKEWDARMLAILGSSTLDADAQKRIASKLLNDPDAQVKAAAAAALDLAAHPASRRPAPGAQPNGQPPAAPGTTRPAAVGPATQPDDASGAGPRLP